MLQQVSSIDTAVISGYLCPLDQFVKRVYNLPIRPIHMIVDRYVANLFHLTPLMKFLLDYCSE